MKYKNRLILEFTEFNLQRMNPDSFGLGQPIVDNPSLSTNAFDKHEDGIRQIMARIDDILFNLKGTTAYADLRSRLALENQDIQSLKILRITKSNHINYDVYVTFIIGEEEYWGKIINVMSSNPEFESEVFKNDSLLQPKEWIIKIKGLIIKTIKIWLKPKPGIYRLLNEEIICYSTETGKQLSMEKGIEIELIRSYDDKIIIKHEKATYNLLNDNFIYFNWWFEPI